MLHLGLGCPLSIDGPVDIQDMKAKNLGERVATVLDYYLELKGQNPYGELTGGWLKIEVPLIKVKNVTSNPNPVISLCGWKSPLRDLKNFEFSLCLLLTLDYSSYHPSAARRRPMDIIDESESYVICPTRSDVKFRRSP